MKKWNRDVFNEAVRKIKYYSRAKKFSEAESKGYDLTSTMEIYLYIADVVLEGNVAQSTVSGWTKESSNGPRDIETIQKLEDFFGVSLQLEEQGEKKMPTKHSNFVKEKTHEIHIAVLNYLFYRGDENAEEEFWKMCNTIDRNRIAVPQIVYQAVQGFVDQYLEEDLFGAIYSQNERVDFDLSEFENVQVNCPNPELGEYHMYYYKLQNMYDEIAEKYLRPILLDEEH